MLNCIVPASPSFNEGSGFPYCGFNGDADSADWQDFYELSFNFDGLVKSLNSRRANFAIMRRTYRTLNDCEMQRNAGVGLFTRP